MSKIFAFLSFFFAGAFYSLQAESIWEAPWDTHLLPPNLEDRSGMDQAKREFSFMNDPFSVGYYEFLCQAMEMRDADYKSVVAEGWVYRLAGKVAGELKKQGVEPHQRSSISTGSSADEEPLVQIVSKVTWLADPTSRDYLDFMDFGDEIMPDKNSSLESAIEQFFKYRLGVPPYNVTQNTAGGVPASRVAPSTDGPLTVEGILARRKAEEEEARQRRQAANSNNKAKIAAKKEEKARLREAARSRPWINVNVH